MRAIGWVCTAALAAALAGCGGGNGGGTRASDEPQPKRTAEERDKDVVDKEQPGDKVGTQDYVTLYDRLGGETGVNALVDDWVARVLADPRVNFERRGTRGAWQANEPNVARLKQHFVQFIAVTTGGPAQYGGRRMDEVHKGMKISNTEFDAMMDDLRASLSKIGVAARDQRDLMRKIELTREQIVERRS
jgi:hemoglobin